MSGYSTATGAGLVAGPLLGGYLYGANGYALTFLVAGIITFLTAALLFFIPLSKPQNTFKGDPLLPQGNLLLACIAGFVSFSEGSIIYTLFPAYASYLNFLPAQIGLLLTIYMVGRTVLFMPLGELVDKLGCKFMIMLGLLGISVPFAAMTRATSFWQFALIAALLSVLGGALYLGALTAASSIGGAEKRGHILGVYNIVTGLGWSVAPVIGGVAADLIVPTAPYALCALLALIAATLVWTLK